MTKMDTRVDKLLDQFRRGRSHEHSKKILPVSEGHFALANSRCDTDTAKTAGARNEALGSEVAKKRPAINPQGPIPATLGEPSFVLYVAVSQYASVKLGYLQLALADGVWPGNLAVAIQLPATKMLPQSGDYRGLNFTSLTHNPQARVPMCRGIKALILTPPYGS